MRKSRRSGAGRSAGAVARHLDQSKCSTSPCLAQSVHSRSGDNLTAHPESHAAIIRQASGFPTCFDEFLRDLASLCLQVQLDHPHGIWQVTRQKLPHRVGGDGTSAQALLASTKYMAGRVMTSSEKLTTLS